MIAIVVGLLIAALFGLPLFLVLAAVALALFTGEDIPGSSVVIEMLRLASSPMLVAIPLFTFAGTLFAEGGAPKRLVSLSRELFGWMPGGLSVVALVTCALFTAFTGASGVTIVAVGGLLLPALVRAGYPEKFSLGLVTTSGSLGLLFPPSLPLILYAYVAGVAVDDLFLAGIVPGILLVVLLSLWGARQGGRGGVGTQKFEWASARRALREAAWEVPLPFVVLGGIYSGAVTVTEAASITAIYALVAEVLIYRDVPIRRIPQVVRSSMVLVAGILVILAAAFGLTNYLIDAEVPMEILGWMQGSFSSKWTFLLALNGFLLIVGSLMDIFSALIVVVPLIVPIAEGYGVNLVHLGIIFLTNLEIGYSTPPVGLNLFISSYRFGRSILELYRASLPFLVLLLLALAIITYAPALSLFLPQMFGHGGTP
ncbi:MAG: TRAP transporter large permease subunit [bacterium]